MTLIWTSYAVNISSRKNKSFNELELSLEQNEMTKEAE